MRRILLTAGSLGFVFGLLVLGQSTTALANDVVGVARCGGCHPAARAQWAQTPHAKAATRLTPAQQTDPKCAACHSTDAQRGHFNVQCESCHGPGSSYWPEGIMRDPIVARAMGLTTPVSERVCRRCHGPHAHMGPRFDFPAALLHIRHEYVQPGRSKGL